MNQSVAVEEIRNSEHQQLGPSVAIEERCNSTQQQLRNNVDHVSETIENNARQCNSEPWCKVKGKEKRSLRGTQHGGNQIEVRNKFQLFQSPREEAMMDTQEFGFQNFVPRDSDFEIRQMIQEEKKLKSSGMGPNKRKVRKKNAGGFAKKKTLCPERGGL